MDVDGHRLCHLGQIRPIAVGSDHGPVGTFTLIDQLWGNHLTNHTDPG